MSRLIARSVAAMGVLLLAGCGAEGGGSGEDFAQQLNERTRAVAQRFDQTFQELARASQDAEIPQSAKGGLGELAGAQRQAADEIAGLDPPEGAEEATADLVRGLREHASRLEQAMTRETLTFDGLTAATAPPPRLSDAVAELRSQGIDVVRPLPGFG